MAAFYSPRVKSEAAFCSRAPAGPEQKRFQPGGWQLKAAKRYLDHRGMKLVAASRPEPIMVSHCKLAALGESSPVAWGVAGEASDL